MSIFAKKQDRETREQREADTLALVWDQYQQGLSYLDRFNVFRTLEDCYRFFEGDQWAFGGQRLQTGGDNYPVLNFIEPTVRHKVATICMNSVGVSFSPAGLTAPEERERSLGVCKAMESHVRLLFENFRLDVELWSYVLHAAIGGLVCVYLDEKGRPETVDQTNLFLGDEQEGDIQRQPYIIIRERRFAEEVRAEARRNGVPDRLVEMILPDEETERSLGEMAKAEIKTRREDGKCTTLLKLWKGEDGDVHFLRCTKDVLTQPEQVVTGLKLYPLATMVWNERKGSARGRGEVWDMIPAQIEVNKNLARRIFASKQSAFPRLAYDQTSLQNPEALNVVGAPIAVDGSVGQVRDLITYLQPQPVSGDAKELGRELISITRELHNAGDAVMGNINPEQASGAAIVAAKNQAEVSLNWQREAYKALVEAIARIWVALTVVYRPNGLTTYLTGDDGEQTPVTISGEELQ